MLCIEPETEIRIREKYFALGKDELLTPLMIFQSQFLIIQPHDDQGRPLPPHHKPAMFHCWQAHNIRYLRKLCPCPRTYVLQPGTRALPLGNEPVSARCLLIGVGPASPMGLLLLSRSSPNHLKPIHISTAKRNKPIIKGHIWGFY